VDTGLTGFEESTMRKTRAAYPPEFRRQMVELVRAGRSPEELAREFEPTAQSIRNWLAQSERNAGRGDSGLTTAEREELNRLRRENRQLRLEREILSKAAAWFARDTNTIPRIAAEADLARHDWTDRGVAPIGYIKGMALVYARAYCELKAGNTAAVEMAKAQSGDTAHDALAWYDDKFAALEMRNDTAGGDTLRHLFVLLIGLGMRESSGRYCAGRDIGASNTDAETAEAGLLQTSFNARSASPLLPQLFAQFIRKPAGFVDVFEEGVECTPDDFENFGDGDGRDFQRLSKVCPAFAVEFAAVGLRNIRKHWGPINKREAEILPACDTMLRAVQAVVDAAPDVCSALETDKVVTETHAPATLRRGMAGYDVIRLQEALRRKGFPVTVDGIFGLDTEALVRQFQASNGLTLDGIVGSNTWARLV
jgi:transposase-like protein